jgi:hypothetical protein
MRATSPILVGAGLLLAGLLGFVVLQLNSIEHQIITQTQQ